MLHSVEFQTEGSTERPRRSCTTACSVISSRSVTPKSSKPWLRNRWPITSIGRRGAGHDRQLVPGRANRIQPVRSSTPSHPKRHISTVRSFVTTASSPGDAPDMWCRPAIGQRTAFRPDASGATNFAPFDGSVRRLRGWRGILRSRAGNDQQQHAHHHRHRQGVHYFESIDDGYFNKYVLRPREVPERFLGRAGDDGCFGCHRARRQLRKPG